MQRIRKFLLTAVLCAAVAAWAAAQSKLRIEVTDENGKPVSRASVIVKFLKSRSVTKLGFRGKEQWELPTSQMGVATLPPIPQGTVRIQVIAKGYQTFGQEYEADEDEKTITIKLQRPQAQYSAH